MDLPGEGYASLWETAIKILAYKWKEHHDIKDAHLANVTYAAEGIKDLAQKHLETINEIVQLSQTANLQSSYEQYKMLADNRKIPEAYKELRGMLEYALENHFKETFFAKNPINKLIREILTEQKKFVQAAYLLEQYLSPDEEYPSYNISGSLENYVQKWNKGVNADVPFVTPSSPFDDKSYNIIRSSIDQFSIELGREIEEIPSPQTPNEVLKTVQLWFKLWRDLVDKTLTSGRLSPAVGKLKQAVSHI